MKFIKNGPDFPHQLLDAHNKNNLVFFCGAGISYKAGLPNFKGLVDQLYHEIYDKKNTNELQAFESKNYDRVISLLENRVIGGKENTRRAIHSILTPKMEPQELKDNGALKMHASLLILASGTNDGHDQTVRLVTTNFDRLFEIELANKEVKNIKCYQAPLLPAANHKLNGIIYLHGLLPESSSCTADDLNQLVLSSDDFGSAYLTQGWASNFVKDLLREYSVCFVGYSVNDPVISYMMDAHRASSREPREMFVFASYDEEKNKEDEAERWKNKNLTPILYRSNDNDHELLHNSIEQWALFYKQTDAKDKIQLIDELLSTEQPKSLKEDDNFVVDQLIWALSDKSGLPALSFSKKNTLSSSYWIDTLINKKVLLPDLSDIGDNEFFNSVRSALDSYYLTKDRALLRVFNFIENNLEQFELLLLLTKINDDLLNNKEFTLLPSLRRRCFLHMKLRALIKNAIDNHESAYEKNKNIESDSANDRPSPLMCKLWLLFLEGQVTLTSNFNGAMYLFDNTYFIKSFESENLSIDQIKANFNRTGMNAALKYDLLQYFLPVIEIFKSTNSGEMSVGDDSIGFRLRFSNITEQESNMLPILRLLPTEQQVLQKDLPWLEEVYTWLPIFEELMTDSMELMKSLRESAKNKTTKDTKELDQSIMPLGLMLLLSWTAMKEKNPMEAEKVVTRWRAMPWEIFTKLANTLTVP
jgi:SIR2-like domain